MADPWDAFPDAEAKDEWDQFPDAEPVKAPVKAPFKPKQVPVALVPGVEALRRAQEVLAGLTGHPSQPPLRVEDQRATGFPLTGEAVDGDTLERTSSPNLRLYGADAPELNQQGWNRDLDPVAIGKMAKDAAAGLVDPMSQIGSLQGMSYGRPVAPVTTDGRDVGEQLLRSGNALAAPGYLASDPERRFDYMQAERLARLNRLGMHDTFAQTPEQFRRDPEPLPERETVAQFFDTPTPNAGMRPEVERQAIAMMNDPAVPVGSIVAFARENGFVVDPADIEKSRAAASKTETAFGLSYEFPKVLTDQGDGALGAGARGVGSGALANMLDEAGAVVDTLGGTSGRENVFNSDRRLADIVANNWRQNEAVLGYDAMAHPYARLGGEIAGGLVVPFGAKATSAIDLAKVGAAYGAAAGFGSGDELADRLTRGAIGTGIGTIGGVALGKGLQAGLPKLREGLRWARGKDGRLAPVPDEAAQGAPGAVVGDDATQAAARAPEAPMGAPGEVVGDDATLAAGRTPETPVGVPEGVPPQSMVVGARMQGEVGEPVYAPDIGVGQWLADGSRRSAMRGLPDNPVVGTSRFASEDFRAAQPPFEANDARDYPIAMDAEPMPSVSADVPRSGDYPGAHRPTRMDAPLTEAQMRAAGERIEPGDVLPIPSNEVANADEAARIDAGRIVEAKPADERGALTRQTLKTWNGAEVPKVGPVDLVGWLRLRGGLKDQGGELSHMGLNNAARRGMDFVGQEQRFGPLVNNDSGSNLDDAAHAAWEAGYFPELSERPDIDTFLSALRETHDGRTRRFLPDDLPQVERFEALRQERWDLEDQRSEAGGPVYVDRSMPADEPPPFPPPEAFEDWPAGGPDFAGNIRLDKLESPQDIARALSVTEQRVGFDAATRGRVSQAETERLASELGMTPDTLIARRKGQAFNAEEALAARQILAKSGNELVNLARKVRRMDEPGDEDLAAFRQAWVRHAAIQEQVAGATAEAGRALQQFRMSADSRVVKGDVLSALVNAGGGRDRIKEAADILIDAAETSPGQFNALADRLAKPKWRDKLVELWINSLLSGPQTHAVNFLSNTMTALGQLPEHALAAGIGKVREVATRQQVDRVVMGEVGTRAVGLLEGAREGMRLAARTFRTGEPSDVVTKVETEGYKAISGLKGEVIRLPTRTLSAADELFKGMARRMEVAGLAHRQARNEGLSGEAAAERIAELVTNPTDEMLARSLDYGRYLTFQRPLGPAGSKISGFVQDMPIFKLFLPFIRTPTNLLKFAVERSPAAPLLKEWRSDFMAGGARRDLAVARAMVGTGVGMTVFQLAQEGHLTGSGPADRGAKALLRADGWQPYSIRVGDEYVSYQRLDPFASTLGIAATIADLGSYMTDKQREKVSTLLVASVMQNLASKTWLSGISSVTEAIADPDRYAGGLVERLAGSIAIPAGVAQVARTVDPIQREVDGIAEAIKARVPGLSQSLEPMRDAWGAPVEKEGGLGSDILSPLWLSTRKDDPVNAALLDAGAHIGKPGKTVRDREMTPAEYGEFRQRSGELAYGRLGELVKSDAWGAMSREDRQDKVSDVVSKARKETKAAMFGDGKAAAGRPDDPWSAFPDAGGRKGSGDAWNNFPDVPQTDVVGSIEKAIPGVRFTSGYRDQAYQADMRRRGYRPADNSGHLDGSSLDILPPPGKSLSWLVARMKRVQPNAHLLPEGDHLHATFPGWYGAPVLGGARAAGLRNPMAVR